ELSIRTALGGSRARLLRQLLTESALLSLLGGALGLALADSALGLLIRFAARLTPRAVEIGIDANVLLFALAASLLTGLVFGSRPALGVRQELTSGLREGSSQTAGGARRTRARAVLVVGQIALSIMLLAGAGLMLRSLVKLLNVGPGFRPESVLAARVSTSF